MNKKKYAYLIALALCMTGIITSALVVVPNSKSSPQWPFSAPTPSQMAGSGVTLSSPVSPIPAGAASTATADSAASSYFGGVSVRAEQYMHCTDTDAVPNINQDCYVVSVDPSAVPLMGSPQVMPKPATWAIVLIDPATGNVIEAKAGNN